MTCVGQMASTDGPTEMRRNYAGLITLLHLLNSGQLAMQEARTAFIQHIYNPLADVAGIPRHDIFEKLSAGSAVRTFRAAFDNTWSSGDVCISNVLAMYKINRDIVEFVAELHLNMAELPITMMDMSFEQVDGLMDFMQQRRDADMMQFEAMNRV